MIRALGLPQLGRVLEVGCGRGVALPVLGRLLRPSRLVGLDPEVGYLEEAQSRLSDAGITADLVPGDVREMPFPDAAFDLVIDFGTCYHVARPEAALAEIARVLVRRLDRIAASSEEGSVPDSHDWVTIDSRVCSLSVWSCTFPLQPPCCTRCGKLGFVLSTPLSTPISFPGSGCRPAL
jgi:SAM-dependent methyltransferase